jgi:hypothetical protein
MTAPNPRHESMRISILCLLLALASAIYCAATAAQPLDGRACTPTQQQTAARPSSYSGDRGA